MVPQEVTTPIRRTRAGFARAIVRHVWPVATLCLGAVGGATADALSVPLGWLLGAMIATATLCCLKAEAHVPSPWRYAGQMVVGMSAGLAFTPALVAHVVAFSPLILVAVLASVCMGIALSGLLARHGRVDAPTAYFASMPGGVAEMSNLAERNGGDVAAVAVAQTLRIFMAVLTVPALARAFGQEGHVTPPPPGVGLALPGMAALAAAASLAAIGLSRRRVPNAWLLGGMASGACVAVSTGVHFAPPPWMPCLAQVLIGASLGARLRGPALRAQRRLVPVTMTTTAILLLGNVAGGWLLSLVTATNITTTILSTSPGGLAEMGLTAVALRADVGLVTAFHLVRTIAVATLSVPLYHASRRLGLGLAASGLGWPEGSRRASGRPRDGLEAGEG